MFWPLRRTKALSSSTLKFTALKPKTSINETPLTKRGLLPLDKEPASNDVITVQSVAPIAVDDQTELSCRLTLACGVSDTPSLTSTHKYRDDHQLCPLTDPIRATN